MTRNKLSKLKRELAQMRRGSQKGAAVESLARRLGRKPVKRRGKEPMWESVEFGELFVLSIPRHKGKDLATGTLKSILDQLEDDILAWEERLGDEEDDEDEDDDGEDDVTG
jgi:hypothetical protein